MTGLTPDDRRGFQALFRALRSVLTDIRRLNADLPYAIDPVELDTAREPTAVLEGLERLRDELLRLQNLHTRAVQLLDQQRALWKHRYPNP